MDVGRLVARASRRFGDRVAIEGPDATRTFAETGARVAQLSRALLGLGLEPGDRVLDLQSNSASYVETDLGISAAGLVRVALNYRLRPRDWTRIAEDCRARALVYDARFADEARELVDGLDHVVAIGGDAAGRPYERLLGEQSTTPLDLDLDPDALVSLNYSSGTTGLPKGAQRTHRNRLASLTNMLADVIGRLPGEREAWVHAGPVTHTSGLFVLPYFAFGARQIVLPSWDPDALLDAIENRGGTATALVPTMVARLLASPGCTPDRTRNLGLLGYAGAPMPPGADPPGVRPHHPHLVQYYGLVEAIPPVTVLDAADHARALDRDPDLLTSAGRPCLGVDLRVVDDAGRPLPAGEVGEVVTRGDHVMRGYWAGTGERADRDDLGKAVRDGWLHTGDLGRLDGEGGSTSSTARET
jgi:acyl-CoA synthetase (AMP-forming)/AMP-acid ligase II